jgi:hypothetical protein
MNDTTIFLAPAIISSVWQKLPLSDGHKIGS